MLFFVKNNLYEHKINNTSKCEILIKIHLHKLLILRCRQNIPMSEIATTLID